MDEKTLNAKGPLALSRREILCALLLNLIALGLSYEDG